MHRVKTITIGTPENPDCGYCKEILGDDNFLVCAECTHGIHIKCLPHASTPGDLLGDVFFDFECAKCMRMKDEVPTTSKATGERFVRQRLPWLLVITLALYNLSIKAKGLSHHGYFHWRTHIISFIDRNWEYIFEPNTRRRKNWMGSVSGALSHNSPEFFLSGQEVFNEHGWWKLTHANQTPRYIYSIYEKMCLKRQQQRRVQDENSCGSDLSTTDGTSEQAKRMRHNDSSEEHTPLECCARAIPYMGRKPTHAKEQINIIDDDISKQQPLSTVQTSLLDFLAENLGGDDLSMFSNLPNIAPEPLIGSGKHDLLMSPMLDNTSFFDVPELRMESLHNELLPSSSTPDTTKVRSLYAEDLIVMKYNNESQSRTATESSSDEDDSTITSRTGTAMDTTDDDDEAYKPRIVQVTNFQEQVQIPNDNDVGDIEPLLFDVQQIDKSVNDNGGDDSDTGDQATVNVPTQTLPPCKPSLFRKQVRRKWPWLVERSNTAEPAPAEDATTIKTETNDAANVQPQLGMLSLYEERQMLQKLHKIFEYEQKCQLEIPTHIRRFYRKLCVRQWQRENNRGIFNIDEQLDPNYHAADADDKARIIDRYQLITCSTYDKRKSFYARIAGVVEYEMFESPYTQRVLHPFIFRSKTTFPPWLKLMCEIKHKVNGVLPTRAPIDYCYVRPQHIAAVNALLEMVFWPGIDMSECLSYPDYTVVALYRKLVIGCGFLVPDVGFNEAYISFMAVRPAWQRSGIATFMLYHLIQTCMSKDITLHVSATNPAVLLYQKFGFKIEEVIHNFYDKYLPIDSKHSRHAFFLRLMR